MSFYGESVGGDNSSLNYHSHNLSCGSSSSALMQEDHVADVSSNIIYAASSTPVLDEEQEKEKVNHMNLQ